MSKNTSIEWADHTFNPWIGCTKVSPGCDHCYAERDFDKRHHIAIWGPGQERHRTVVKNWGNPRKWNDEAEEFMAKHGRRQRVFCASLADWLDNEIPIEWFKDLLDVIRTTPNLDWLLLTKRMGNWNKRMEEAASASVGTGALYLWINQWLRGDKHPKNVWIGATVVNQEEADRDVPKLLRIKAAVRFLSIEPMLGPVSLRIMYLPDVPRGRNIDWVIVGGESGPQARPTHPDWVRGMRDQCLPSRVPFLFKQWGEWAPAERTHERDARITMPGQCRDLWAWPDGTRDGWRTGPISERIGKKAAGRLLDGMTHDGYPVPRS